MSVIAKILDWSKKLPSWQSDVLRRLFLQHVLTDKDYDDLVALAKLQHGILDEENRVAEPLSEDVIPATGGIDAPVAIRSISDTKNVNALASSDPLVFAEKGVTVIYGDNGSGKSGYARVLKRACRARDDEVVLPNATVPKDQQGTPEALLTLRIGEHEETQRWIYGHPGPRALSTLSVFDGHCARVYLDEENDVAFKPYGLDIIENLAKVCLKVRTTVQKENDSINVDVAAFDDLKGSTRVGVLIAELSSKTDDVDVALLAELTAADTKRFGELTTLLGEANPAEKAKALRATVARLDRLAQSCELREKEFGKTCASAVSAEQAFVKAKRTSDLVPKSLPDTSQLLPGTGGQAWKELLEAALRYSPEAYPQHHFPHVGAGAKCLLCQQELIEGADRYRIFGEFVANVAEQELRAATNNRRNATDDVAKLSCQLPMDDEFAADIRSFEPALADSCASFGTSLVTRLTSVTNALASHDWQNVTALTASPAASLRLLSDTLQIRAAELERSSDKAVREKLEQEHRELVARRQLASRKESLLTVIEQLKKKAMLKDCAESIDTTAISKKAKSLTEEAVSEALSIALNVEFGALGIDHLKVTFATRGDVGRTLHKLRLDLPGSDQIGKILSEGEQRALAIGSFLAEVSLAPGSAGLVFDDPVSSLDHLRRARVADRLVKEGGKRQVVIFTHDLYFLGLLTKEAGRQQVPMLWQRVVKRGTADIGVVSPDLPFMGQNTKQRVGRLRQIQQDAAAAYRAGKQDVGDIQLKNGYEQLRESWEQAVEEVLFQGVVERFQDGVHTQELSGVVVEDRDYLEVDNGMSRCSSFTHDRARAAGTIAFDPAEFAKEVEALEAFRSRVQKRSEHVAKDRKAKTRPPT